jgi:hypothetical protein
MPKKLIIFSHIIFELMTTTAPAVPEQLNLKVKSQVTPI